MGKESEFWFPQHHLDCQSPNLNFCSAPLDLGQQNTVPLYMNCGSDMVHALGTSPEYVFSELTPPWVGHASGPRDWFSCLSHIRQAIKPAADNGLRSKLPVGPVENSMGATSNPGSGCASKRFLVFDHSGDQTTLIFSSGIGAPVQRSTSWSPKPLGLCEQNITLPGTRNDHNHLSAPVSSNKLDENPETDGQSDMSEDTEELNALLYSEDDSDCTEDDLTSTGHSPNTVTAHVELDGFQGSTEEVANYVPLAGKRKIFDGGYESLPSLLDTASSMKRSRHFEHESDAESCCGNITNPMLDEMSHKGRSGETRMRMEKLCETVSILQGIIPDGKGKDATVVLDEAILYLKSLKIKAKALGLTSL